MSNKPKQEWITATEAVNKRVLETINGMEDIDLGLSFVSPEDAKATNSTDDSFLTYLKNGAHLNNSFLANANNR